MINLAQGLTAIRKERGMTVDQVVAASGVTKSTAAKVFSGIETNPKMDTVMALLAAMDATLSDIDPVAQKEKAPALNEQELSEQDQQIVSLLPFVPEAVKAGVLQVLAATVDLAAAAEYAGRYIEEARELAAQADSDGKQQSRLG
jgi:transcriptional regulator with XRE-family HTH domain